jgi:hypothetical protein
MADMLSLFPDPDPDPEPNLAPPLALSGLPVDPPLVGRASKLDPPELAAVPPVEILDGAALDAAATAAAVFAADSDDDDDVLVAAAAKSFPGGTTGGRFRLEADMSLYLAA